AGKSLARAFRCERRPLRPSDARVSAADVPLPPNRAPRLLNLVPGLERHLDHCMRPDLQVAKCQEDEMNRIRGIRVVMGICAALAASSARADGGPFVGRWHWNRAQSKLPPGGPVPNDLTSEISRAD